MDYLDFMDEVIRKRREAEHYRQYNPPLTDYQIAQAFQGTLSLIYKDKMKEINDELQPAYDLLDSLDVPQRSDEERYFARAFLPARIKFLFKSAKHINRIRNIKIKEEDMKESLQVEKARAIPIETLYDFRRKGKNVSCPFHGQDKTPSMSLRKNRFHCFTCGASGSNIDFFMRYNKVSFVEAVKMMTGNA